MNQRLCVSAVLIFSLGAALSVKSADTTSGGPVIIEYYYKIVPGGMMPGGPSEWLSLYLKNHHPILKQLGKEGLILSEKVYERRFHADWAALQEASQREPEIIRSLYPDKAAHDREEKRRWELTERHWDDVLKEVPVD